MTPMTQTLIRTPSGATAVANKIDVLPKEVGLDTALEFFPETAGILQKGILNELIYRAIMVEANSKFAWLYRCKRGNGGNKAFYGLPSDWPRCILSAANKHGYRMPRAAPACAHPPLALPPLPPCNPNISPTTAPAPLLFDDALNSVNRHRDMAEHFHAFIQNLTAAAGTTRAAAIISLPRNPATPPCPRPNLTLPHNPCIIPPRPLAHNI